MIRRRDFLRNSAAAATLCLAPKFSRLAFAQGVAGRIEVVLDEVLGTISPNIYGHFVENLSGVVYDGIWVGENSKVPNVNGIRKELSGRDGEDQAGGGALPWRMLRRQLRLA